HYERKCLSNCIMPVTIKIPPPPLREMRSELSTPFFKGDLLVSQDCSSRSLNLIINIISKINFSILIDPSSDVCYHNGYRLRDSNIGGFFRGYYSFDFIIVPLTIVFHQIVDQFKWFFKTYAT